MRILINAVTVKFAGGLVIAHNFLNAYNMGNHEHSLLVVAPENNNYEQFESKMIKIRLVPDRLLKKYKRFYLKKVWLKNIISEFRPDIIFSLGNIPLSTNLPQAILLSNPFVIVKNLRRLNINIKERIIQHLRSYYFKRNIKYVKVIFTQTKIIKHKLFEMYRPEAEIIIVPMASSLLKTAESYKLSYLDSINKTKLLCLARYYKHKNLEILIDLARIIKKNNSGFIIIITIEKKQGTKARKMINEIERLGLEDIIINAGEIKQENIKELYERSDGLILPTLLESYSATYSDALFYKKPIFTSDLDFAKEACGDAAYYFNPLDADNIYNTIISAFQNTNEMQIKILKGVKRVNELPDWNEIANLYIKQLEKLHDE
ncbi:MAG: glycosyltransferase [Bacteroidota bacterium]